MTKARFPPSPRAKRPRRAPSSRQARRRASGRAPAPLRQINGPLSRSGRFCGICPPLPANGYNGPLTQGGIVFKVRAKYLLLIACVVWLLAGLNIFRLGLLACLEGQTPWWVLLIGIPAVFIVFHMMFSKLVGKHSRRIDGYGENRTHVLKFFDLKGYLIMIVMMGGGIALRSFHIVPTWFVAFFYTGLGAALSLAGIGFLIHYMKKGAPVRCPVSKHSSAA